VAGLADGVDAGIAGTGIAVEVSAVSHRYGETLALAETSLRVPAGARLGLIGPDGAGKSTLLGLVAGVRRIQQGGVRVLGGDMADARHRSATSPRIAYMPQGLGRNLYQTLSVRENVEFFGRLFGQGAAERRARIDELLHATGLFPFAGRAAGKLSGGMKQKLGLCCALIHDPDLLILDEPTTGVDPLSRRQFWELVDRIHRRRPGMTILVATAYMEEAGQFEQLVAMHEGRLLASGTPAELMARTGAASLESAYVRLLPQGPGTDHRDLEIAPHAADGAEIAIAAAGLTKRFGDFTAVDRVEFQIMRGTIFGFLGSNGCGKTTTMKMLTGLLPITAGEAWLFGQPVDASDIRLRSRIGYMSQGFSLYEELTVAQNLDLHARLFHLPRAGRAARLDALIDRFELGRVLDQRAGELPLGMRQRLSLAIAVIHEPEILILDEPTSGVDPLARDHFWQILLELSRQHGVTIFISTHFMNEAARCDRVALMHAGRVLAQDAPEALVAAAGADSLEHAFIRHLEQAGGDEIAPAEQAPPARAAAAPLPVARWFSWRRFWAFAWREALEIGRDPIRLAFAWGSTLFLMVVMGLGISFDVENLRYAVLDHDQTPASRLYLENFAGSRYFRQVATFHNDREAEEALLAGKAPLVVEIPPGFGDDLWRGRRPEVAFWIEGGMPFRAENIRAYAKGIHQRYVEDLRRAAPLEEPVRIETRFRYNQDFRSVYAIAPGVLAVLMLVIPATLTALGVVREKELGSITNLYASPATRAEFLLGKQLPYAAIALGNFVLSVLLALAVFEVPFKGSWLAYGVGALIYVFAATAWGLLISVFTRTQIAAIFAAFILTMLPATNFSGLIKPVASLTGGALVFGRGFPASYFLTISVGTFTKALDWNDLLPQYLALAAFVVVFIGLSLVLLRTQER
jgi:ribosome-dependent ATPase